MAWAACLTRGRDAPSCRRRTCLTWIAWPRRASAASSSTWVSASRPAAGPAPPPGPRLCAELRSIERAGADLFVEPVREHRFLIVLRGDGLSDALSETDPQRAGVPPREAPAETPAAAAT